VIIELDQNGHYAGDLYLEGYKLPLPGSLARVGGNLCLGDYKLPLPGSLARVGGNLSLGSYPHPLPESLARVGGNISLVSYPHPLPRGLAATAPLVEQLDRKILAEIEAGGTLEMGRWHDSACATTHCRAGWAIHLAGAAGYELERRHGPEGAGALIYERSTGRRPDFFASTEDALADIRACAARPTEMTD
jgi:hypothetical protein